MSDAHGPSHFEAEVISVERGKHGAYFLWLLRTSDSVNINALLSSHLAIPTEGDMVVVRGDFEENQEAKTIPKPVRLRITSITHLGRKSARYKEWQEALETALVGHKPVKETRTIRCPVIVTGRNTAVEHDIRKTLEKAEALEPGFPQFEYVDLGSAESIAEGVRQAARVPNVRAIVLARGGTSEKWQLLPFSHPAVVRVVAEVAKSIPVVVAIGHAEDHPLCERVASFFVPAPSAVGELFHELNQARKERLRRDAVEMAPARLRHEEAVREANAPAQAPSAPGPVVANAPQSTSWVRRRWRAVLAGVGVVVLGGAALSMWVLKAPMMAAPPLQPQPAAVTPIPSVPPVKTAQPTRRRQKPKRKPSEKAAAVSNVIVDAGTEQPPAAPAAPPARTPIDVFE
ncbi:exodeoxyribonuclease VII large subunit [Myxococcus virescens]|uniref:Exonuclease VII large subunit C-terminal domain-containing protein n=2 Tax=Myxococcus virescens TaxID=83456 RepID=A0A511HPU6_9BACT|nr:exodeoxyribonuclease VII large subunit [Myxococcus virescens]GEL75621.1 hypothetical protein MVI01_74050 [Myxococcus virescens]